MRAHYFQHVAYEGLGSIEPWLKERDYEITFTRFYNSDLLPGPEDVDFLIVLGGPMSINDESGHPWLRKEKNFINSFIKTGKPILGICLGAQLIAAATGGTVYANPVKEIGWFPVQGTRSSGNDTFRFPRKADVFHWHGETFSLPAGALRIAENQNCQNQAFQIGRNVIGLQFHLETTEVSARAMVENSRDELLEAGFIQSEREILSAGADRYASINSLMGEVLEYLETGAADGSI